MILDAWLPIGSILPDGNISARTLFTGADWQIVETRGGGRTLLAREALVHRWVESGLLSSDLLVPFDFGGERFHVISTAPSQRLAPVAAGEPPESKADAQAFALALRATREIDGASPIQDAIYVEKITRLLPTYSISSSTDDDVVLGYYVTGGVPASATSLRRLQQLVGWMNASQLKDIAEAAGFTVPEQTSDLPIAGARRADIRELGESPTTHADRDPNGQFELPGRPDLAAFFNEHVIDIVRNQDRYRALGITFPSAIVLHGPPGTGKTFAVERLVEFLGWPMFQIDASSVASPYIHETSRKIAAVFDQAMSSSPSVLVIDEMEAFLADRDSGEGHHRIEEVAEFLRRIPEAVKNEVLIVAMTNRVDMIDSAVLRRGRFDHVIEVGYASEDEVASLLTTLLGSLPVTEDLDVAGTARALTGRPLSDVAFVVREAARIAARSGKIELDGESLDAAMSATPSRRADAPEAERRIGFI